MTFLLRQKRQHIGFQRFDLVIGGIHVYRPFEGLVHRSRAMNTAKMLSTEAQAKSTPYLMMGLEAS